MATEKVIARVTTPASTRLICPHAPTLPFVAQSSNGGQDHVRVGPDTPTRAKRIRSVIRADGPRNSSRVGQVNKRPNFDSRLLPPLHDRALRPSSDTASSNSADAACHQVVECGAVLLIEPFLRKVWKPQDHRIGGHFCGRFKKGANILNHR